ncbi:beta-propeller domain-containing protein [uncultured Serinicoccus sp.]|uniref:beta-propeller domain-containing protein n=1 Tax=uncultured Serinicoccus sp. TaxID=735514 RepID=UPI00260EEFAF|nr:beta-propeller domain-containing protein [uncultured Serinicoccus sp.]
MTPSSGRRTALAASLLAVPLALGACTPADVVAPPRAGAAELTDFGSCEELLDYVHEHALEAVGPWGLGTGSGWFGEDMAMEDSGAADSSVGGGDGAGTAVAGRDFSGTNNQEQGVEEPDVVQTDGEILVTARGGRLVVVDVATRAEVGALRLPGRDLGSDAELLLDRTSGQVLVLTREWPRQGVPTPTPDAADGLTSFPAFEATRTVVTLVDVSDPANPTAGGTLRLEGDYRSARMQDGTARVVMVTAPPGLAFVHPRTGSLAAEEEAEQVNREIIEASTLDDWLPHVQTVQGTRSDGTRLAVPCEDVARPPEFSGLTTMSVLTFDLARDELELTSAGGLVASGSTVYASTDRLVVATSAWEAWSVADGAPDGPDTALPRGAGGATTTALHTFDLTDPASTEHVASGSVPGRLLNQFSLDEDQGTIRVATTTDGSGSTPSSSSLVVLAEAGDRLVEQGRVDGLGETEQIYAVRYLSPDTAAVVTFRQTDPLYLLDTSDPTEPRVTGELKIPGYSAYLHPVGEDLLLGVGQDATDEGRTTGLQVSLFDISDLSAPTQVAKQTWADHGSGAEHDHRAFTWWPQTGQLFLPAEAWTETSQWTGVISAGVDVDTAALTQGPRLQLGGDATVAWDHARRTLVIGDHLWILGESTLHVADLATLEPVGTVDLRA